MLAAYRACPTYKGLFAVKMNIPSDITFAETVDVRKASSQTTMVKWPNERHRARLASRQAGDVTH